MSFSHFGIKGVACFIGLMSCASAAGAEAPVITVQPKNRSIVAGTSHTFSVTATGDAPLSYQWSFASSALTGETNSTLQLTNIQPANAGNYFVVVSNNVGAITSVVAILVVRATNDPAYAAPDGGWTYRYDGNGTGSVANAALDGTWNRPTSSDSWAGDGRGAGNGLLGGVSSSNGVLTIEDAVATGTTVNNRRIYLIHNLSQETSVTNANTILDEGVTLTFRARITPPPPDDPLTELTNAPNGYVNFNGGKGMFGIRQSGGNGMLISFSLNRVLEDINTTFNMNFGQAGLHMNSLNGNVSGPSVDPGSGVINLLPIESSEFHEFWVTIQENGSSPGTHRVSVYVDGAQSPTVFNVTAGTGNESPSTITNYLAMGLPSTAQRGGYDIDFYGYKAGVVVPTGYNDPVAISAQPVSQSVALGQMATFSVAVAGTPPFAFQWYRDGSPVANATNSAYTTEAVDSDDHGDAFVVIVSNLCNIVTSSPPAVLQILIPPTITTQPQSLTVTNGDPASFTVVAESAATLYYQWRFNGGDLSGQTNSTLAFSSVSPSHGGSYDVIVSNVSGSVTSTVATLVVYILDFGDAPDSYATLLANNGVRHFIVSGIHLGAAIDADVNGQTNGLATGDDLAGTDDEDGVTFASPLQAGNVAIVEVVASTNGFLNAWMDFNGNGAWIEAGDQIFTNQVLSAGTNLINFVVPGTATANDSFARFRFSATTNLSFNGPAADGEVEDYAVTIAALADLALTMLDAPDPVAVNSNILYRIAVTNAGPSTATSVFLDDALPPGVTVVYLSSSQGSCARIGDTIRCTLGTLAPNAGATVNVTLAPSVSGSVTNTAIASAEQSDPFAPNNTATEVTTVEAAPSITIQPVSLVVTQGGLASFTVTASGSAPLGYQWFFSGNALSGETNTTLNIASAQPSHEGAYTVRITNRVGGVLSAPATLRVLVPPAITQQPSSRTNAAGSPAIFSVTATGSQPLFYQWFRNGASLSSETNATITLNNVQTSQAGDYALTVSNGAGVVTSAVARLNVVEVDFGDAPPPYPTLVTQNGARHMIVVGLHLGAFIDFEPDGLPNPTATGDDTNSIADEDGVTFSALLVGQTGTVAVVASTGGILNAWIDWAANGDWSDPADHVYTNHVLAAGTNVLSLSIPSTAVATNTLARFRFSSLSNLTFTGEAADGEVEDYQIGILPVADLSLSVIDAPDPVVVGSNLVYTVTVTNSGPPTTTDVILTNNVSGNVTVISAIPSQGSCSNFSGVVRCALGTVTAGATATVQLTVTANEAQTVTNRVNVVAAEVDMFLANNSVMATTLAQVYPVITSQPQSETVTNSSTAVMAVTAIGTALQYQWFKQGTNLAGEINPSLIISNVQAVHAGTYTVRVSNSVGVVLSDPAVLTVLVRPQITTQPQTQTVRRGDPFTLSVTAAGTQPLAYQWFLNGTEVPGATSPVLSIGNAQSEHAGTYTVLVSNSTGSEQSQPATITIVDPPGISQQPQGRTNTARTTVTFSVEATGTAPLSYRWYFNQTTPLANATNTTLTLTNVQRSQDGNYSVVVTNAAGAVTSVLARLVVLETDFGDAPPIGYPTLFAFNGARHQVVAGVHLGSRIDFEADGQPSSGAIGDDTETSDDEDGITFTSPLLIGQPATLQVVASTNGFLDAWIDFDRNGAWSDLPDQIFFSQPVSPGINLLSYQAPSTALATNTFARFRFSTNGGLLSDGAANSGEVEDYPVTVHPVVNLSAEVSSIPEPVPVFSNLTYTITVSNSGPSACSAARLFDPLPPNLQFVSVSSTRGSCINDGGTIDCNLGTLGQGQAAVVSLAVRPVRPGGYTNQITVTGPEFDSDLANNTVEIISTAIGIPAPFVNSDNLVIADPGIASPYPSTITVAGLTSMVYNVTVTLSNLTHNWPADLDVLLVGPAGQSVLLMSDAAAAGRAENVTVKFDDESPIAIPEAGRLVEATFRPTNYGATNDVLPAPAPPGPYGEQLSVFTGTNPNGTWSLYVLDDEAQDSGNIAGGWRLQITTLHPIADLGVTVRAQPEPVAVESNLTYTVSVTNRGPAGASGVVLSNLMPPNATFISTASSQGSCTNDSGLITCELGNLAVNASATVTLVVRPERGGPLTNAFTVSGNETDVVAANNTAVVVSSVRVVVDVVLALTEAPEPAAFGQSLNYFLRVTNLGPSRAHGIVASDPLPPGITFAAVSASQGSCSNESGTVVCNFGELTAGAVATATITATVNVMGPFTNTASVTLEEIDMNPANNIASEVTTGAALFGPLPGPGVAIPAQGVSAPYPSTISVSGLTGEVYEVSVTLSNISHAFPDDLDILLVGPEGQNVLLASDAGDGNLISNVTLNFNDSFTAQLPDSATIVAGQFRPTQYDLGSDAFPPGAPAGPYGTNLAVFQRTDPNGIWSLYILDDRAANSGSMAAWSLTIATLAPIADVSVAATASPDPVGVGSNLVYTFAVTNRGPAPATGVTLSNRIPASVSFVSVATSQGACSNNSGTVQCAIGGLAVGSSAQVTVTVVRNTAGILSNHVAVTGTVRDHRLSNNAAALQTTVENPPVVVQHPQSITVTNGGAATFGVSFTGAEPFSFEWLHNGVALPGQTNSTLVLTDVQLPHAGTYRVRVSNRVGAMLSDAAALTVLVRPGISTSPAQSTDEDVPTGPITFTVEDYETAAAALVVTATSSDALLVPQSHITLSGTGTNRFIEILPGTNQFGAATITLTVQDADGITATANFQLTVRPVNDPPSISAISDQTAEEDTPKQVSFSVSDLETDAGALVVRVNSSDNSIVLTNLMVLGGSGSSRTVQFQSAPNQFGVATISLTVRDTEGAEATTTFVATIAPVNDPPTLDLPAAVLADEDSETQIVPLTGITAGPSNETQMLVVSARSSNPSLIPDPVVTYASPQTTGSLTLTFMTNAHGTADITVTVQDDGTNDNVFTRTFGVTVRPVNDPPQPPLVEDVTVMEDSIASGVTLMVGDIDTPPEGLTVSGSSSNAVLLANSNILVTGSSSNRIITLSPSANEFGTSIVILTVTDTGGVSSSNTFLFTVLPLNDPPTLDQPSPITVDEDSQTQIIQLTGIASGPANESQMLTVTARSSNPALVPDPVVSYTSGNTTGSLALTFETNAHGAADIIVTVQDDGTNDNTITRTFGVTVRPVNDAPQISVVPDVVMEEDSTATGLTVVVSDIDSTVESLTVTGSSSNAVLLANSNIVVTGSSSNRSVSLSPSPNEFGMSSVTLTVSDGSGGVASNVFLLTVLPVNDPPTFAVPADLTLPEDSGLQTVAITGISSGFYNEAQTITVTAASTNVEVLTNLMVTYSSPEAAGTLSFGTVSNVSGVASITITADDGAGSNNITVQTFTVTIEPVNDSPQILPPANETIVENSATAALPFTIGDMESPASALAVTAFSSNPALVPDTNIMLSGSDSNRFVTVTPLPNQHGVAVINLRVTDPDNGVSVAGFSVNVTPVNHPPTISTIPTQIATEDTPLAVPFMVADRDEPLETLQLSATAADSELLPAGSFAFSGSGTNPVLTITPATNASGATTVTLTVRDSSNATASTSFYLAVNAVNDAPTISDISNQATDENVTTGVIPFTVSDIETAAGSLQISAVSSDPVIVPQANIIPGGSGSNRTVRVRPGTNQTGRVTIRITVRDTQGAATSDNFDLTINSIDAAQDLAAIPNQTMAEDQVLSVPIAVSDPDTSLDSLVVSATSSNPSVVPNSGLSVTGTGADRILRISPAPNQSGVVTITVAVADAGNTNSRTFQLTIAPVNDAPSLDSVGDITLPEDFGARTITLSGITAGAADENEPLTLSITAVPTDMLANLTLSHDGTSSTGVVSFASLSNVTGSASITVSVNDGGASNNVFSRTFNVIIEPSDDPPEILPIAAQATAEDTPLVLAIEVRDEDTPLQNLLLSAVSSNQILVPDANIEFHGSGQSRLLVVSPATDQFGSTEIRLSMTDGTSTNSQTFLLDVIGVNDAPTLNAVGDIAVTTGSGQRTIDLLGITAGAGNESQTLSIVATSSNPALIPDPSISYTNPDTSALLRFTPAASGAGTALITITVDDGGASNNITVRSFTIFVRVSDNQSPTISSIADQTTPQNTPLSVSFQIEDSETPADSLMLEASSQPSALISQLIFGGSGTNRTLQISPATDQTETALITISVTDGDGAVAAKSFLLTVTPPAPSLSLSAISDQTTLEDTPVTLAFTLGHPLPDFSVLTATSSNTALLANTNILFSGSGSNRTATLVPSLNATGTTLITLAATNGSVGATRAFLLTVTGLNDPPTLNPLDDRVLDSGNMRNIDVPLSGITSGAANEIQTLSITATSTAPTIVSVLSVTYASPTNTGSLRIRMERNVTGIAVITVNVSDGQFTNSRSFTVFVKLTGNASPTISAIPNQTIDEDTPTGEISFTIGDSATPASLLMLSATSFNSALVPNSNVVFGGSGSTRTVTVTPLPNQSGTAVVRVTVTDTNFGMAYTNFTVTVRSANDLPTASTLSDLTVSEDSDVISIPISVGDVETPASHLVLSATSQPSILISQLVIGGSGSERIILITPAQDQFGIANIDVNVQDADGGATVRTFNLAINAVNDAPTLDRLDDLSVARGSGAQQVPLTGITSGASNENQVLTVTAVSSQPDAIPHPQITYNSPDTTGTLTFAPTPSASGSVTMTVTVSDGGASNSTIMRTFSVAIRSAGGGLPTISDVSDQTIVEDTTTDPLPFTVGDGETPLDALTVTASSSNPALVVPALDGSGSHRTVTLTPLPDMSGTATVTIAVIDSDFGFTSTSFLLTVNPTNDVPTITTVENQTIVEDTETPVLPVTIGDVETLAGNLVLTASSSNPTLIPDANIFLGGSGTNRTVVARPLPNQAGVATITLRLSDPEGAPATTMFDVTVTGTNDPPSISPIEDQVTDEDVPLGPISVVIDDIEPGTLTLSVNSSNPELLPPANVIVEQASSLVATPVTNKFGETLVTLTISDQGGATVETSFLLTVRPINDPPTLDTLNDMTLNVNAGNQVVSLSGITSGDTNEFQTLAVSAISSNPHLIPHPAVTYASPATDGTFSFRPVAGASGTATITVTVNDGQPTNNLIERTVTVTVNGPPVIGPIADQVTDEDVPAGPIAFTLSDANTSADLLNVTVSSSYPALIPNGNITLSGAGTNRFLTITPVASRHGFSMIHITASDPQGNSSSTSFALMVLPVNDRPSISEIPDQSIAINGTAGPIGFSVYDLETAAADLWVTAASSNPLLVPEANILLQGNGSARSVTIQPLADRQGTSAITISVTDTNGGTTTETFLLTVNGGGTPPTITRQPTDQSVLPWRTATFVVTASGNGPLSYQWRRNGVALSGATSPMLVIDNVQDSDAGEYSVEVSNAHGTIVSAPARLAILVASTITAFSWSPTAATISFETLMDLEYTVQYTDSFSPASWNTLETIAGTGATVTITDPNPASATRFYRIRAE